MDELNLKGLLETLSGLGDPKKLTLEEEYKNFPKASQALAKEAYAALDNLFDGPGGEEFTQAFGKAGADLDRVLIGGEQGVILRKLILDGSPNPTRDLFKEMKKRAQAVVDVFSQAIAKLS